MLTVAEGINNRGEIVGLYVDTNGNQHGFVFCSGFYMTIDMPGETNTEIFSINASGEIVGSYDDAGGVTHGFLGEAYPQGSVLSSREGGNVRAASNPV